MTKKVLIGVAVLAVVLVAVYFYLNSRSPLSPPGKAELTSGELTISIPYSRPSVRGRVIFGTKENGALQPYGDYWRLGANAATEVTFSRDVIVNGQPVPAGTYRMYAIPGPERFEIALNSELGKSGSDDPDASLDVVRTAVSTERLGTPVEQFTITPEAISSGINIIFEWEKVRFVVPVTTEQTEQ